MSRLLYFDCFSGISGDMVLGALIDAGLPLQDLTHALGSLAMAGYDVSATSVLRAGLSATRFVAHENHESPVAGHGHGHDHGHGHGHDHHHEHPARKAGHEHP